jgi:hypothetical protein
MLPHPIALILERSISMFIYKSSRVMPYVYQLTHKITGHYYIGYREANKDPSTQDLGTKYFTSSKITKQNFKEYDLTIIAEFYSGKDAHKFEDELIRLHINNPLNINQHITGMWSTAGIARSEKAKSKAANSNRGKKRTKETRQRISDSLKIAMNRSEVKDKISKSNTGRKATSETKIKLSKAHKGKIISEATKIKLSKALKGFNHTDLAKNNMSNARIGMIFSDEHRANIGKARMNKKMSNETKQKISKKLIGYTNCANSKQCTIDGIEIFPSYSALVKKLGYGKNGCRHPYFRYII